MLIASTSWVCQPSQPAKPATKMDMKLDGCKGKLENLSSPCLDPLLPAATPGWCPTLDQGSPMLIASTSWVCHDMQPQRCSLLYTPQSIDLGVVLPLP